MKTECFVNLKKRLVIFIKYIFHKSNKIFIIVEDKLARFS